MSVDGFDMARVNAVEYGTDENGRKSSNTFCFSRSGCNFRKSCNCVELQPEKRKQVYLVYLLRGRMMKMLRGAIVKNDFFPSNLCINGLLEREKRKTAHCKSHAFTKKLRMAYVTNKCAYAE